MDEWDIEFEEFLRQINKDIFELRASAPRNPPGTFTNQIKCCKRARKYLIENGKTKFMKVVDENKLDWVKGMR
uniref:Uncharacterized protein n=1 Tax=viral metagenome TaxID=1070528 RepID=A0A6C0JX60_9ZZZZ